MPTDIYTPGPPKCKNPGCDTFVCNLNKRTKKWLNYCSKSCERKHVSIKSKITCLEKYGVDNPAKSAITISKMKETISQRSIDEKENIRLKHEDSCLKNHGVKYTFHSSIIKDKRKNTFLERYGVDHYSKTAEFKTFMIESQASYTDAQWESINTNRQTTMLEKYGVDNSAKIPEVHSRKMRSACTSKNYTLPSGKIIRLQGWENKALDELLFIYTEEDIRYDSLTIPSIDYIGMDNKHHKYYPDFYIPKDNLIIEVKSTYTYSGTQKWIDSNKLKEQATIAAGYNFKFMIY